MKKSNIVMQLAKIKRQHDPARKLRNIKTHVFAIRQWNKKTNEQNKSDIKNNDNKKYCGDCRAELDWDKKRYVMY